MSIVRKICLAVLLISPLAAVEISINNDANRSTSPNEVDVLRALLESQRVMMRDNDIKDMIEDDRTLASAYLDSNSIPENVMIEFKLSIEKKLADLYIKKYEEKLDLSDDALKSYYIDHNDEFSNKIMVDVDFFVTDKFDESLKLYEKNKDNPEDIYKYAREKGIVVKSKRVQIQTLAESVRKNLRSLEEKNYLLPPLFFVDHYTVMYIKEIEKNVLLPYDEKNRVKIRNFLVEKNHKNIRVQLLKKLNDE